MNCSSKTLKRKKLSKLFKPAACLSMAATLLLGVFCTACSANGGEQGGGDVPEEPAPSVAELVLPEAEKYALQKYSYEELSDVQTTVRADSLRVTKRGLARSPVTEMSGKFSLVYDTDNNSIEARYDELTATTDGLKTATIEFTDYGTLGFDPDHPRKAVDGANAFTNGTMSGAAVESTNANFYKYMYMTQGQHLAMDAAKLSKATADDPVASEAFKSWLKKHPAADGQYGKVLGENNAVEKEIILDPIYRSPHVSGLYLPAGEAVTVKIEGLKAGEKLSMSTGYQNSLAWRGGVNGTAFNSITGGTVTHNSVDAYFYKADVLVANNQMNGGNVTSQSQWARQHNRAPWVICTFTFDKNATYVIGSSFGGLLHIEMNNCYSRAKVTVTGAVETPHYILGVTTPNDWDEYYRNSPGVIGVIDTENGQLIGPVGEMDSSWTMRRIKKEEIDKLSMLWHSFLSVNESFTGGTYNRFNKVMFDEHVPAGAAVALGNYSFAHPVSMFTQCTDYQFLLNSGTWGPLHEIGHSHAAAYGTGWGFCSGQEGEVRNNALTLLSYIQFLDVGTHVRNGGGAEHGMYADPYKVLAETLNLKGKVTDHANFSQLGYFPSLGMYANIMHSFGADKYYELLYSYSINAAYCSNKRADFAYRCSTVYKYNFLHYFNDFYGGNITDNMFTEEQLAEMKALPDYDVVANKYAGGIDGVKTAGDYKVAFGEDITFDLKNTTATTHEGGFEIVKVGQPEHGKIAGVGDGKYVYSFDRAYTGTTDSFTFDVQLPNGVKHRLQIYLRISYNSTKIASYNDVQGNNLAEVINYLSDKQPDAVNGSSNSYIATYQSAKGKKDVRVQEFYWKAPKSGLISLSCKMDDWGKVYFGDAFDSLEELITVTNYINSFKDYGAIRTVEEGKYYAVRVLNVNAGGGGSAVLGIKYEDEENYANSIPSEQVFHPDFPLGQEVESFVFEPKFMVSQKDKIKLTMVGTDKSEWKVIKAPTEIHGGVNYDEATGTESAGFGHYEKSVQYVLPPEAYDENGNEIAGWTGERIEVTNYHDMWDYLIDDQTGTFMHTRYQGKPAPAKITPETPHEFIIDTKKSQQFNYISVTTRNNANSYITDYAMYISESPEGDWKKVAEGNRDDYKGQTILKKFNETSGRYVKIVVKGTSGNNFSVLAEIDAGIQSSVQKIVSPANKNFFRTSGWKDSSNIPSEPNGYLICKDAGEKLIIKFKGEGISLYAATGAGFGTADFYLDGVKVGTYDFDNDDASRRLVFNKEDLADSEHVLEVVSATDGKIMLSVIGIPYKATVLDRTLKEVDIKDDLLFATNGFTVTEDGRYVEANKKNEKVLVKFKGDEIALYAATGEGYGSADVYLDGKKVASVNLDSADAEDRKTILFKQNLSDREHLIEIVTTSAGKVMIGNIAIPHAASLINAANIYKERALAISLIVFISLFVLVTATLLVLVFVPKIRKVAFGNRFIKKLDERQPRSKKPKSEKSVAKEEETVAPTAAKPAPAKATTAPAKATPAAKPATVSAKPATPAAKPATPAAKPAPAKPTAAPAKATPAAKSASAKVKPAAKPDDKNKPKK